MKFEDVLPKMRDEGRIAVLSGNQYIFFDRNLYSRTNNEWILVTLTSAALTSEGWSLEPRKVKKSCWSFGTGTRLLSQMLDPCTEEEATKMRIEQGFEWKEEIVSTRIYEEES